MAFYIPPVRHPERISFTLWLLILSIVLLLFSFFLAMHLQTQPKERPVLDSAIAVKSVAMSVPGNPMALPDGHASLNVSLTKTAHPSLKGMVAIRPLEATLTDLLNGPDASAIRAGHYSEIPEGTELLGVSVSGNTVIVDLSEEFVSGGGSTSMLGRVEELKKAVADVNRNYIVKIAINGKQVEYIGGEGLEVNK